ncbi:TonB-dependent receptor [Dysgonomonas sp. Marseille-P4677]|uniref:SusC/RagA family TonB-linked outer membrane protein n=1 Tax=Dysgonomonas sp. Marseille-P4677 TaxID=2364790 RepID=UPI0019133215|nr:TonB-dependent receptor [Dysgonomonas sp. Marseille-P4677]MBK5722507.1 TonB-dependent receptor [Dysgonomonas sp. Marseille-P4677]
MKLKIITFFIALLNVSLVLAQTGNIVRGTVIDQDGEPLIGVAVSIKGTTSGTITDLDGKYSLAAEKSKTIVFTYIGYETKEVIVASNTINVTMESSENILDDVIVVAYGTASKAGYTGSASTVKAKDISKSQVSSVSRLLQGTASGVQSVAASGQPGSDADIFIRGVGSINASSKPLYIVDGAPYDGSLNSLNPADIESINVLKDAASTALYGSRAGNGLIIITTKQGRKNEKAVVDARFTYGISGRAVKDYKQVTTNQYFQMTWEAMRNQQLYVNGATPDAAAQYATDNLTARLGVNNMNPYGTAFPKPVDTNGNMVAGATPLWNDNWSDEYTQDAHRLETNVGISGGSAGTTYYISLNYLDDQGIAPASDFKRYTGRVNLNSDLKPWLRVSTSIGLTHSKQNAPKGDDTSTANALFTARLIPSFYPIWKRDPNTGDFLDGKKEYDFGDYRPSSASSGNNHLGTAPYDFNRVIRDMASIRAAVEIDIYKGLSYRGSINIDYTNRNNHNYYNPSIGPEIKNDIKGSVTKYNYRTTGSTGNNVFTYKTTVEDVHNLKFLAEEYYEYNTTNFYGQRSGLPALSFEDPDAASLLVDFGGYSDQYKLLSYFGSGEYNYNNKYYASASIRRDGSSRFSPKSRWGTFWSVGGSWRISEEDLMKNIGAINKLSLRASYGGQGNDNLSEYYAYKALFKIQNNLGESGFVTSRLDTEDLQWETNLNLNIGLDYAFFNSRLTGSFEYFNRRSKDLLFEIPKPLSTGYSGLSANIGAMKNYGVELSITGRIIETKDLKWDLTVNATHYKNKITELPQEQIISGTKLLRKGGSIYDFFMVEWAGIDPEDGLPQWYMTNDNGERVPTKTYNNANTTKSKIVKGSAIPDLVGGFSTNLTFKDFEFSALFAYSIGGKLFNQDKLYILHNGSSAGRSMSVDMLDHWTPENRYTDIPRLQTVNSNSWTSTSTRFLVDASYMRMKNMTIGYNLPKSLLKKIYISNCKVFLQGENLFTIFGEQGLDPEQNINGVSYFRYPAMRTGSVGVNLTF